MIQTTMAQTSMTFTTITRDNNFIGGGLRLDEKKLGKLRDDLPMLEDNEGV